MLCVAINYFQVRALGVSEVYMVCSIFDVHGLLSANKRVFQHEASGFLADKYDPGGQQHENAADEI